MPRLQLSWRSWSHAPQSRIGEHYHLAMQNYLLLIHSKTTTYLLARCCLRTLLFMLAE